MRCAIIRLHRIEPPDLQHPIRYLSRNHVTHYNNIVIGFSRKERNSFNHCAPTAPSTTR